MFQFMVASVMSMASVAHATSEELQCYRVADQSLKRLKGIVDLAAPDLNALAPGCKLSKSSLYCVPGSLTVQPGTLFDGRKPIVDQPGLNPAADSARLCYSVTCPKGKGKVPNQSISDRFGAHDLTRLDTAMVCTPAAASSATPSTFTVTSPDVQIDPGQEVAYCYYFRTPNTAEVAVSGWRSTLPSHALRMSMILTSTELGTPGTQTSTDCSPFPTNGSAARVVYAASVPSAKLDLPANDGTGKAVGLAIPANQPGYLWIQYVNAADTPASGHVEVTATMLQGSQTITYADTYLGYSTNFSIPPQSQATVDLSCPVPSGSQFFMLTTQTNKHSVHTVIKDANTTYFESVDFADPGRMLRTEAPYVTFSSDVLNYQCSYFNTGNTTLRPGASVINDEVCTALGYYFPSAGPKFCVNGILLP